MPYHKDLTGTDLHESKGVSSAAADTVAVADGAGSTSWQKIEAAQIDATSVKNVNIEYVQFVVEDPNSTWNRYIVFPFACTVTSVSACISTKPSTANLDINFYKGTGTGSTMASISFATAGADGDTATAAVSTNNTYTVGGVMRVRSNSGSTSAGDLYVVLTVTLT